MRRIVSHASIWLGALVLMFGSSAPSLAAETHLKDDKSLRETDIAFAKAAAAKELDRVVSYYADDASMFPPNAPIGKGKEAIKKNWMGLLGRPGLSISWEPTTAVSSKNGDLGYTSGTYQMSATGPDGKPVSDTGKYVEVWRKDGGKWKVIADIFNSDLPPPAPPKQG